MASLYKSETGKKEIYRLYDEKLASLDIDYQAKTIPTNFGATHLLITGNPSHPPIVLVHGSNACAPIALETYAHLSSNFHVFALDLPGQPNKSEAKLLSMKDDSYGKWMQEVLTQLQLEQVTLAGFSLGGLVILKALEYDESNIKEVFLSAPAYIVNGNPLKALLKVFIPMRRYMKTKRIQFVEQFLAEIFSSRDEFAVRYLAQVFLHFTMDFTPVPTIKSAKAQQISTPITLIAAKQDILFPGEKMLKRAKKIFPSLQQAILLEESKHVQTPADNEMIEGLIIGGEA